MRIEQFNPHDPANAALTECFKRVTATDTNGTVTMINDTGTDMPDDMQCFVWRLSANAALAGVWDCNGGVIGMLAVVTGDIVPQWIAPELFERYRDFLPTEV